MSCGHTAAGYDAAAVCRAVTLLLAMTMRMYVARSHSCMLRGHTAACRLHCCWLSRCCFMWRGHTAVCRLHSCLTVTLLYDGYTAAGAMLT